MPYDSVMLIGFGGPEGPDEVLPFLRRVTRGKGIPDERLAEVGRHYEHFGGVSPINQFHRDLQARLAPRLQQRWPGLELYWGNRNTPPFISDAMKAMLGEDRREALGLVTSGFSSYSGCRQYREDIAAAADELAEEGISAPRVDKIRPYFDHPLLADIWRDRVTEALRATPPDVVAEGRVLVLFSTHSLPSAAAAASGPGGTHAYVRQHRALARVVMASLGAQFAGLPWDLCFQSRSGPPQQPWLEPDVSDRLAVAAQAGVTDVVLVPIGFLSDHIEVLWDLDTVALDDGRNLGLRLTRVLTPGTDERFIEVLLDVLAERLDDAGPRAVSACGPTPTPCPSNCCLPVARTGRGG